MVCCRGLLRGLMALSLFTGAAAGYSYIKVFHEDTELEIGCFPAQFSGPPMSTSLSNLSLITPVPPDACGPIANPYDLNGRAVLVQEQGCLYLSKVTGLLAAGAAAVIVYNEHAGELPFEMQAELRQTIVDLPACMVSYDDGNTLLELLPKEIRDPSQNNGRSGHRSLTHTALPQVNLANFRVMGESADVFPMYVVASLVVSEHTVGAKQWDSTWNVPIGQAVYNPHAMQKIVATAVLVEWRDECLVVDAADCTSCWVLESPLSVSLRGKLAVFRTDSGRGFKEDELPSESRRTACFQDFAELSIVAQRHGARGALMLTDEPHVTLLLPSVLPYSISMPTFSVPLVPSRQLLDKLNASHELVLTLPPIDEGSTAPFKASACRSADCSDVHDTTILRVLQPYVDVVAVGQSATNPESWPVSQTKARAVIVTVDKTCIVDVSLATDELCRTCWQQPLPAASVDVSGSIGLLRVNESLGCLLLHLDTVLLAALAARGYIGLVSVNYHDLSFTDASESKYEASAATTARSPIPHFNVPGSDGQNLLALARIDALTLQLPRLSGGWGTAASGVHSSPALQATEIQVLWPAHLQTMYTVGGASFNPSDVEEIEAAVVEAVPSVLCSADSDGCNMCRALQRPFNTSAALSGKIALVFADAVPCLHPLVNVAALLQAAGAVAMMAVSKDDELRTLRGSATTSSIAIPSFSLYRSHGNEFAAALRETHELRVRLPPLQHGIAPEVLRLEPTSTALVPRLRTGDVEYADTTASMPLLGILSALGAVVVVAAALLITLVCLKNHDRTQHRRLLNSVGSSTELSSTDDGTADDGAAAAGGSSGGDGGTAESFGAASDENVTAKSGLV